MNISNVRFNKDSATIELKAKLPLLSVKNKVYFGIFMTKDLNGAETKAPIFSNSKHDFFIKNLDLGKELTMILSFDKKSFNSLDNIESFCFGLRDFGVRWFPETLAWVKNEFLEPDAKEVIPTDNAPATFVETINESVGGPEEVLGAGETIIMSEILFQEKKREDLEPEPALADLSEKESLELIAENLTQEDSITSDQGHITEPTSDDKQTKSFQRRKGKKI
jgi:hypothetical protein